MNYEEERLQRQLDAESYTCQSYDIGLATDKELTDHVNEEGRHGAYQVNRRRCQ